MIKEIEYYSEIIKFHTYSRNYSALRNRQFLTIEEFLKPSKLILGPCSDPTKCLPVRQRIRVDL